MRQVNVTWKDINNRKAIMGIMIADAYDDGVYAELQALLEAIRAASECQIENVTITKRLDVTGWDNDPATQAGEHSLVDDQGILTFRAANGLDARVTVPGPLRAIFDASGGYSDADVDESNALVVAILAAGITEPVLVAKDDSVVVYRKGWRKGQHHS